MSEQVLKLDIDNYFTCAVKVCPRLRFVLVEILKSYSFADSLISGLLVTLDISDAISGGINFFYLFQPRASRNSRISRTISGAIQSFHKVFNSNRVSSSVSVYANCASVYTLPFID